VSLPVPIEILSATHTQPPFGGWKMRIGDIAWCWLCALFALAVFYVPGFTPDSARFLAQADQIAMGNGFVTYGRLETWLPPGYPVFIAALKNLGLESYLRALQFVLHMGSVVLIYQASVQFSRRAALATGTIFALSPLVPFLNGYILSETLGVFLCALALFMYSRLLMGGGAYRSLILGAALSALALTSPAVIFLAFGVGVSALLSLISRRDWLSLVLLVGGAVAPMIPWQQHCYRANGELCYFMYTDALVSKVNAPAVGDSLFYQWFRSWSLGERHMDVYFRKNPGAAPRWVFSKAESQSEFPDSEAVLSGALSERQSRALTQELAARDSAWRTWAFTMIRSVMLWFDMRQMGHVQMEYVLPFGVDRIVHAESASSAAWRLGKLAFSTLSYIVYISLPIVFIWACLIAKWRRRPIVPIALFSVLAYTAITAFTANNESRRNIVFYPAMLYVVAVAARDRGVALTGAKPMASIRQA
jgi:hypothetical protein